MTAGDFPIVPDWKWGTPEGSRELDRLLDRRLTFREKLMWLEEAETLSLALEASRAARQKADSSPREIARRVITQEAGGG